MSDSMCLKVAVLPESALSEHRLLLTALGQLHDVRFVAGKEAAQQGCRAAFLFGASREEALRISGTGLRCLAFIGTKTVSLAASSADVDLSSASCLPACLQGRVLRDDSLANVNELKAEPGEDIVATKGGHLLWLHRPHQGSTVDFVAIAPPRLTEGDYLFNHFQKENWIRLLPILCFLRRISGWEYPPARACFMVDDPNLHWKTYGYIRYRELAGHAAKHNYHISFATVPLDGWYAHPETAALFRDNKPRLSLLIHGNNHTSLELAQEYAEAPRQALAIQALQRIERLERASGVEVPRVMAAPHGACSEDMAAVLLRTGFEAACISRGSIMARNPNTPWPTTIGLNPAEFLGGGLPIVPRFRLRKDCLTEILSAACLGQPIIPVGHHGDLAGGLDLLRHLADAINSIGQVQWMNMESVARSNFCTRREGTLLQVKMYSRKIRLKLPEGVNQIRVHRPWLTGSMREGLALREDHTKSARFDLYQEESIPIMPGGEIEIASIRPDMINLRSVPVSRTPLWMIARRQLCEARDRVKPAADRLLRVASRT